MVQFDPGTGLLSVPIWVSATTAAVLVVLAVLALARSGVFKTLFSLLAFGLVVYGGWMGWLMFERLGNNERVEERRVYEQRVSDLAGRATAPGSVLGCLDSGTVDALATGCEKSLFDSAENAAAAVAYVSARISLLIEGLELAARSDVNYDNPLNFLRQKLEADRYGVVAYVMAQQPNCLPQQCQMLALLRDANRVRSNLQDKQFEALIAKYSPQWSQPQQPVRVGGAPEAATRPSMPPPPGVGAPLSSRYELPSAASIPPVSIMNSETSQPAATGNASPPAAAATPGSAPPAARRPPPVRAPVARAPEAAPPVPLAPSAPPAAATPPPAAANPPAR